MSEEASGDYSGQTIGNWRLLRRLGEGAFGAVYEVENVVITGRRAAMKVLHAQMSMNADIKRRFINEASAASRTDHENIVQVFDAGVAEGNLCWAVMELLRGKSLAGLLASGALDVSRTVNIGAQVASALQAAHALGIIHRDLKPDNVFVTPRETNPEFVKVLDFGVAKLRGEMFDGQVTSAGVIMGTPAYMSPEQWMAAPDLDGRSDIYALGVILFECVVGRLPFTGTSIYEFMNAHVNQPPPDLAQLAAVPASLAQLVTRMLAKQREERPQTMREAWEALTAIARPGSGVRTAVDAATLVPSLPPARQPIAPTFVPPPKVPTVSSRSGSRSRLPAIGAAAALLAIAGAAAWILHGRPTSPITEHHDVPPAAHPLPAGMVAVPAGTLRMGRAPYGKPGALDVPEHEVKISAFALERTEVTIDEYRKYVEDDQLTPPWPRNADLAKLGPLPVTNVAPEAAQGYCHWHYPPTGRLPTEAEWEWAARGPGARLYPWGDVMRADCVNGLHGESGAPSAAGALACGATPSGILDLSGNVWEWTSTRASAYPGSTLRVPSTGDFYVVRGGSFFNSEPDELTATSRQFINRPNRFLGFRCAIDAD